MKTLLFLLVTFTDESASFIQLARSAAFSQHSTCLESQSASSSSSVFLQDGAARAGDGGYSVLRQPPSRNNWDPDAEITFEVPLDLEDQQPQQLDTSWWSSRSTAGSNTPERGTTTSSNKEESHRIKQQRPKSSEPETLDLYQRTLETLDFPRILQVLEQQCTTVPAKRIIRQQLETTTRKQSMSQPQSTVQPLMAEDVIGCQDRYQAVRELQWLRMGTTANTTNLQAISFAHPRNNKKQSVTRLPFLESSSSDHMFDIELLFQATLQKRVLQGPEIRQIVGMLQSIKTTIAWAEALYKQCPEEMIAIPGLIMTTEERFPLNETLLELLTNALEPDSDTLSGITFPRLAELRQRVRSLRADILATLDQFLARPDVKNKLALESGGALYSETKSGRLVVPVDSKYANSLGMIHDTSRSGKTSYVEPKEMVTKTNQLRVAEGDLRQEEARLWRLLTEQIILNQVPLEGAINNGIAQLDLAMARLIVGDMMKGVIPSVENEGVIVLENAKHPVLLLRQVSDVVGSNVDLGRGANQGLVLTGPNSGGKTIVLKLLGLMALMAKCGIPVPADGPRENFDREILYTPRVDCFQPVLADIGDIQSVGGDLSTFSGHMLVCREVLANSRRNSLVLMDEPGAGTDPAQGVAIAQALLESLLDMGARVAITTHFMQLKQLAASDDRFAVGGMQFVNGRPTYKLIAGAVGESFALSVAERLKLPQKVIDRANELLDSETRQMGDLIRELEDQKVVVDLQAIELESRSKELAKLEQKLVEEKIRLEKKQLIARREEAKKFAKQLEEKEQALEDILRKLKEDPSRRVIAKSWDDIKLLKRDVMSEAENVPSVLARKQQKAVAMDSFQSELQPLTDLVELPDLQAGDQLMVCKKGSPLLGRIVEVVNISGKNRVTVKVNGMGMTMKLSELSLPISSASAEALFPGISNMNSNNKIMSKAKTAAERAIAMEQTDGSSSSTSFSSTTSTSSKLAIRLESNTVDVRGCNLTEAQDKIRLKASSCLMSGQSVIYILHGYGTGGVLRNKIRSWLQSEKQLVKKHGAADVADGGDAFTRVELR